MTNHALVEQIRLMISTSEGRLKQLINWNPPISQDEALVLRTLLARRIVELVVRETRTASSGFVPPTDEEMAAIREAINGASS